MMQRLVLGMLLILVSSATFAADYDCKLHYSLDGKVVETLQGVFSNNDASEDKWMYLEFANRSKRNVVLARREDSVELQMGDFCGEQFVVIDLPLDPGPKITAEFSHGRSPIDDTWHKLHLECLRRGGK